MKITNRKTAKSATLIFFTFVFTLLYSSPCQAQFFKHLGDKVKQTANDHIINDAGNATDKVIDKTEDAAVKGTKKKNNKNSDSDNSDNTNNDKNSAEGSKTNQSVKTAPPSIHSYQNYDFVPGDTILFADDFTEDMDGEFPSHWNLSSGQAVLNKINGEEAFFLTEGNYCQVSPRMRNKSYLSDPFTIEFDYYANDGDGPSISFNYKDPEGGYMTEGYIGFSCSGEVSTYELPVGFSAKYPHEDDATYRNKWHHCALIYKNNEVKCYIDQYRILVIPNFKAIPLSFGFAGIGDPDKPIIINNVRLAKGGSMNMIGKKFTEAKIVTHGITFDSDKSEIKPQSMGTLNMIVNVLKANPDLKFEIDGHTDNTGNPAHNLTLSQERAASVKVKLVSMGIKSSRLTTKGFGDTKPISDNTTLEGKANNRRVEFIRI